MAWLQIERYHDERRLERVMFLPMLCQHCDNAPCESVCPVYAPHHTAEGLNNQIYNRCIGTRFCSQNCPYKVRRFNWFTCEWPEPLNLQLNPDVTVRSKGVMEKCSFCIQRIKEARTVAKNENRLIRDGDVTTGLRPDLPDRGPGFRQPHGQGKPRAQALRRPAGLPGHGVSQHETGGDLFEEGFTRGMRICRVRGVQGSSELARSCSRWTMR